MWLQKEAAAASSTKCRASSSVCAGVQVGDGGGFPSLFLGPAAKRKGQM
jgi:hypothetical protein